MKIYNYDMYKESLKFTEVSKWYHFRNGCTVELDKECPIISTKSYQMNPENFENNPNLKGFYMTEGCRFLLGRIESRCICRKLNDMLKYITEKVAEIWIYDSVEQDKEGYILIKAPGMPVEEIFCPDFKFDMPSFAYKKTTSPVGVIQLRAIWSNRFDNFVVMLPWEN